MATEVKLPRLGQGMESGTIVRWLKAEGEPVKKREPLYELDTDKVTQEVEADADGVLLKIVVAEGEVEVGRTIALIGSEGEDVPASADGRGNGGAGGPAVALRRRMRPRPPRAPRRRARRRPRCDDERERGRAAGGGDRRSASRSRLSPTVDRTAASRRRRSLAGIARERGIDLVEVRGTGPEGRIVAEDVERASRVAAAPGAAAGAAGRRGRGGRATRPRARRSRAGSPRPGQAPVFQLTVSADMTRALELRERLVARIARERDEADRQRPAHEGLSRVALMRHRP